MGGSSGDGESLLAILENKGCQVVFGVLLAVALVWLAILYVGLPVAIIGGTVAFHQHRSAGRRYDDEAILKKARDRASLLGAASAALAAASIAGNYYSDDAPFHSFLHGGQAENLDLTNEGE